MALLIRVGPLIQVVEQPVMDESPDDTDRSEWDRAWRAMPHYRLTSPPQAGVDRNLLAHFGKTGLVSVTISLDPPQFSDGVWRESETCPVCGRSTTDTERLPVCVNLKWSRGGCIGTGVWVHRICLESLPVADGPAPIPW